MRDTAFPWRLLSEPAFAAHATSALPAWIWSTDGRRLIFANPAGAAILGAETCAASLDRPFEPSHPAARQIAAIAASLPANGAPRLQRLRGFGTALSPLLTCLCSRVSHDGLPAVLVTAVEPAGPRLTLADRARRLFAECGEPIAVYSAHGELLFATEQLADRDAASADTAEKLGSGENEIRVVRLSGMASAADAPKPADRNEAAADMIDLTPIAEAISEAQKAMAAERAAYEETAQTESADALKSEAAPAQSSALTAAADHSAERRHPLRFVWAIDADNRFSIEPGDFIDVIGPKTAAELNRPWISIASDLDLDPDGEVARAIGSRDTWSGISIDWPVDGSEERITVELAGLPVYDRDRNFRGYRGFGVCRDLARISALLAARKRAETPAPTEETAPPAETEAAPQPAVIETRPPLTIVPAAENVVPFRPLSNDNIRPDPADQNVFQELATRLTARLKSADQVARGETAREEEAEAPAAEPARSSAADAEEPSSGVADAEEPSEAPAAPPREAALQATVRHDRPLLDLLPVGVLIYRHEHFFYANRAFLRWSGHDNVQDFAEAGGLDTLFIEPQSDGREQTLRIAAADSDRPAMSGHLFSIPWNGSTAMMLVTLDTAPSEAAEQSVAAIRAPDSLQAILDAAADGVVTFDRTGTIVSANTGAERLFGYDNGQLTGLPVTNLFAGDSTALLHDLLQSRPVSAADQRRDVTARTRRGETLPLQMTVGEIDEATLCAAFLNLSRWKNTERDLIAARKQAEAASNAKSDFLAKVSHEIRTPLNAIIGFSDVMMNERFGPVGNERYKEYLKDIHSSGTHLVSLVNDLLDLSKIEAGKLDLSFEPVNLNDLTQQTVALMQPQASRERIIIRTSLAPELPTVVADVRSVKQIVLNLLSNSIKFTGAGGQVILSTARTDHGEAVLRVRDTGVGMSEKDIKTALEPFRQLATTAQPDSHGSGLGLPLTKALVEANSARFSIKSALNAGTLVEIVFPPVRAAE